MAGLSAFAIRPVRIGGRDYRPGEAIEEGVLTEAALLRLVEQFQIGVLPRVPVTFTTTFDEPPTQDEPPDAVNAPRAAAATGKPCCPWCGQEARSAQGLSAHKRSCPKRPG